MDSEALLDEALALADQQAITPARIKAQALALLLEGYSSRKAERRLKTMFPGHKKLPDHSTIHRWAQKADLGHLLIDELDARIADIIEERLPSMDTTTLITVADKIAKRRLAG